MDISNITGAQGGVPLQGPATRRRAPEPTPASDRGFDRVEVSPTARELARAEQAVQGAGELRFEVVSRLRASVQAGTYHVDPHAVARAMVEKGERAE